MANARRAHLAWFLGRLSWLLPSFVLACGVLAVVATDPDLPLWALVPFVALGGGVALLILVFAFQSLMVVRERSVGRVRRAQLLRTELRTSPGMVVTLLFLLLGLLAVRSLFRESPPLPVQVIHRPSHTNSGKLPAPPGIPEPSVLPADPPARPAKIPVPPPETVTAQDPPLPPQILPEVARIPLTLEDLKLPTLPKPPERQSGDEEPPALKHRPTQESDLFEHHPVERTLFGRSGVPSEADLDSWIPPQLRLDFMVVSHSGPWRGGGIEVAYDLPVGRDDSVRLTYTALMLTDDDEFAGSEPSFTWHRGTLEYVRRIAGYTQHATFDLALRLGMTMDVLGTNAAGVRFESPFRASPWFGLETAVWEDHRIGLVAQIGHSPAMRLAGGSSRVTDFRILIRLDLGEHAMLELGYRIVSVQFRDKLDLDDAAFTDKFERSFMGPILGLAFRF